MVISKYWNQNSSYRQFSRLFFPLDEKKSWHETSAMEGEGLRMSGNEVYLIEIVRSHIQLASSIVSKQ